jgi:hypothetical protein
MERGDGGLVVLGGNGAGDGEAGAQVLVTGGGEFSPSWPAPRAEAWWRRQGQARRRLVVLVTGGGVVLVMGAGSSTWSKSIKQSLEGILECTVGRVELFTGYDSFQDPPNIIVQGTK